MTTTEDRAALNRRLRDDLKQLEETAAGAVGNSSTHTRTAPVAPNGRVRARSDNQTDADTATNGAAAMPETDTQAAVAAALPDSDRDQTGSEANGRFVAAGGEEVDQGRPDTPRPSVDLLPDFDRDQTGSDIQGGLVAAEAEWSGDQRPSDDQSASVLGPLLDDEFLALFADVVDDVQRVLYANQNRLRQLTRTEEDSDGEVRGFGLDVSHAAVLNLAAMCAVLEDAEKEATKNLERAMHEHPLWPWVKAQRGVGAKTAARVLAVVGDPAWHDVEQRPRRLSELRSFCGYGDAATQRLTRGRQANWSTKARTRLWVLAVGCVKNGAGGELRQVYDDTKLKYAEAEITDMHRHNRALRAVSKHFLKGLWLESRRLHAELTA